MRAQTGGQYFRECSGEEAEDSIEISTTSSVDSMSGLEAFRQMRKLAEEGQFPEMTLDEINDEIRLAREERRKQE